MAGTCRVTRPVSAAPRGGRLSWRTPSRRGARAICVHWRGVAACPSCGRPATVGGDGQAGAQRMMPLSRDRNEGQTT
jgi:hypothetical protein